MLESKERNKESKEEKTIRRSKTFTGIFLIVFSLSIVFAPGTHLFFLAYPFVFLFGWVGLYALGAIAIYIGIALIFNRRIKIKPLRTTFALIALVLGAIMLAAHLGASGNETASDLTPFLDNFIQASDNLGKGFAFTPILAGGVLGYLIDGGLLTFSGDYLIYTLASVFLSLGVFLLFLPLVVFSFRVNKEKHKQKVALKAKEKDHREKEEALEEMRKQRERDSLPFIDPDEIDNSFFEEENDPLSSSPFDRYRFSPAGSNPVPSTIDMNVSHRHASPFVDSAYSAPEIRGGTRIDMNAPVSKIGLQEAIYEPHSEPEKRGDFTPIEAETLSSAVKNSAEPEPNAAPIDILTRPAAEKEETLNSELLKTPLYRPFSGGNSASGASEPNGETKSPLGEEKAELSKEENKPSFSPSFLNPTPKPAEPEEKEIKVAAAEEDWEDLADIKETRIEKEEASLSSREEESKYEPREFESEEEYEETLQSAFDVLGVKKKEEPSASRLGKEENKVEETPVAPARPQVEPSPKPVATPKEKPIPSFVSTRNEPAPSTINAPTIENKAKEEAEEEKSKFVMPKAKPLPNYVAPSTELLKRYEDSVNLALVEQVCCERAAAIDKKFADLHVGAHVSGYTVGPSVTRFDIETDPNVSVSSITRFMKDISKVMGGVSCRFAEIVPGKTTSAIEVVNRNEDRRLVPFSECFAGLPSGKENNMAIPFGVDIENNVVWGDLSKFPHMLVAGTTGSGKSILIQGILMSLIMRNRPEEVKLMLVDPKRVEFSKYRDIPHLLCPIIKEAKEARIALGKLCDEMDRRYGLFEAAEVSAIREFNEDYCEANGLEKLPFIVLVVDEYADLVEQEKDVGSSVLRLSAKARACGIHLIICTQRPDVKVITGTIKNNLNTRVALHLKTATDSITILNSGGAEELLDHGDMLVDCDKISREFLRLQGCMVHNHEISRVTNHIREQFPVQYHPFFSDLTDPEEKTPTDGSMAPTSGVNLKEGSFEMVYQYVRDEVMKMDATSISKIQRTFKVGYPRASDIFNKLIEEGIVAPKTDSPNSSKPCEVLIHSLDVLEGNTPAPKGPGSYSSSYVSKPDPSDIGDDF